MVSLSSVCFPFVCLDLVVRIFKLMLHRLLIMVFREMDFETGRREMDELDEQERAKHTKPQGWASKVFDWMF